MRTEPPRPFSMYPRALLYPLRHGLGTATIGSYYASRGSQPSSPKGFPWLRFVPPLPWNVRYVPPTPWPSAAEPALPQALRTTPGTWRCAPGRAPIR